MANVTSWERFAKKEGKIEGKLEAVNELLKRGVDMNIIAEATGIPLDDFGKTTDTLH